MSTNAVEYLVIGMDGTDADALDRRLAVRETHLVGAQVLADRGELLSGGALLDDEGRMIGSSMHVAFADEAAFRSWYENEPYVTGDVWRDITIRPMRFFRPAPASA
jgi:uncharacterized protein